MAQGEHEIKGQHIGIIGIGAIGREVALKLKNWGCKISYYDVFRPSEEVEKSLNVSYLPLEEIISDCDIISVHVPVLPSTINMLSYEQFKNMKKNALVINTSRGEIIDQMALADALENGLIYGAALDTISPEPVPAFHPLLNLSPKAKKRLTLTPHIGGTTDEAFIRMLTGAIANIKRVIAGEKPINIVNGI